jgi:hypothetical protein
MDKYEIFSMFQRIEVKLDDIMKVQQERCDSISAEQRKQIDAKVSTSVFKWITSFIIAGIISLGIFVSDLSTKVSILYTKHKDLKQTEQVRGDVNGTPSNSSSSTSGE